MVANLERKVVYRCLESLRIRVYRLTESLVRGENFITMDELI